MRPEPQLSRIRTATHMDSPHERLRQLEETVRRLTAENAALRERLVQVGAPGTHAERHREVADRERAEPETAVSLEKYRVLFEHFPLGITITDADGRIIEANETSTTMLGLPADKHRQRTIGDSRWRIVDPDGAALAPEAFAAATALRECRAVRGQVMGVEREDGSTVWLDVSAAPIPLEGYGVAVTYGDISERVRTEAALARAELRYQALFDHSSEGIALHRLVRDAEGRVINYVLLDINPQYEAIVGLRRDDVVGRLATEVYGTDQPPYLAEFSSAPLTGKAVRFETYFPPMDKHFSISVAPLGADGFATIFFDVSELRRSQEAHEQLSALVENSSEFISLASLDGRVMYINEAGRRLVGLPKTFDVTGLTIDAVVPEATRPSIGTVVLPAVMADGAWTGEVSLASFADGSEIPVDVSVFLVPSRRTGAPICLATVMRDIRERVRARETHDRLEDQLRQAQKMESVGRLAGGVAHDFNNLLTSIVGNTEMVLETTSSGDQNYNLLLDILKAGESAASLTRQLLAFSRKQIIAPTVLDLNRLLANMERMLRRIIGEDVTLETRLSAAGANVRADAGQLEQVIVNLSVNARDAMPEGGRLRLETSEVVLDEDACAGLPGARPGSWVVLSVSDSGTGMDDHTRAHLFEPFFTTKSMGTGLGLAMVYGAVTQNGGAISVDSEPGRGTTFRIFLPATQDEPAAAPVARTAAPTAGTETILLVEDEPLVRDMATRALAAAGYQVLTCAGGLEALECAAARTDTIDLLLTDVIMPGMDGRDLSQRLVEQRPGLRVLLTSGYADRGITNDSALVPGVNFLPKPYTPHGLTTMVRAILDRP